MNGMMTAAVLVGQSNTEQTTLSAGGIAIMTLSIALVTSLLIFCLYRILSESKPSERHHAPLDIDTHDME